MWLERSLYIHINTFVLWFLGTALFAGLKEVCWDLTMWGGWTHSLEYVLPVISLNTVWDPSVSILNYIPVLSPTYQLSSCSVAFWSALCSCMVPSKGLVSWMSLPSLLPAEDSWCILSVRESMREYHVKARRPN